MTSFLRLELVDPSGPEWTWLTAVVFQPVLNAVLLDTGPLDAGWYEFSAWRSVSDQFVNFQTSDLQLRDAANAVTLNSFPLQALNPLNFNVGKIEVEQNERVRIQQTVAGGAFTFTFALQFRRVNDYQP